MRLDRRQLSTILAALRLWQEQIDVVKHAAYRIIATDAGMFKPLDVGGIDELVWQINEPDEPIVITVDLDGGLVNNVMKPDGLTIRIRDYDIEGALDHELTTDEKGTKYYESMW